MRGVLNTVACALTIAATNSAIAQTGTLVVTNKAPSTATIIDVASGRTLAALWKEKRPAGVS